MFTGIVEEVGLVQSISTGAKGEQSFKRFRIECRKVLHSTRVGDSISVNGCCLTVVAMHRPLFGGMGWFEVETWKVSLAKTNLSLLEVSSLVNLERALNITSRLGGHMVNGHVDKTVMVSNIDIKDDNYYLFLSMTPEDLEYIVSEGSVTVDGVSLTVAEVLEKEIMCNIISHTRTYTIIHGYKNGTYVNIEFDMLLKYTHSLLKKWHARLIDKNKI